MTGVQTCALPIWLANLLASSVLYLCAGLFWNITHRDGHGVTFAFTRQDWFTPAKVPGRALLAMIGAALLIAGIVVVAMWPYLQEVHDRVRLPGLR